MATAANRGNSSDPPDGSITPERTTSLLPTLPQHVGLPGRTLSSDAPIEARGDAFTPAAIRQRDAQLREHLITALVDRSSYAQNEILYKPADAIRPTATQQGLELPPGIANDASFMEFFLHETEKLRSLMYFYAAAEHQPFTDKLPQPVFPLPV